MHSIVCFEIICNALKHQFSPGVDTFFNQTEIWENQAGNFNYNLQNEPSKPCISILTSFDWLNWFVSWVELA